MSLSYKNLCATDDELLKPDILLPKLWAHGVRSIELRTVTAGARPIDVLRVANLLWDYGFQITVHSSARSAESAVADVFGPLSNLLTCLRQRELVITVHPVADDNILMLKSLSDHIINQRYPVRIALENNRKMPDGSVGNSLMLVLDAVNQVNRKNIGICFDMGHYAWYTENFTDSPNTPPPEEFLSRVIHTHIHVCNDGTTHYPLEEWREPISLYIDALGVKYLGVYNIELDPKRFLCRWSATEAYLLSADTLKNNYPSRALMHDEQRVYFDGCFRRSLDIFRKKEGCYGTMIAPSSYLFSTNGYHWAMDVSFHKIRHLTETPSMVREYLGGIDCMLLTHAHGDHMEKCTIRALSDTEIIWVVPDFLVDALLELGVRLDYIISVSAGDDIKVGPLYIQVLKGRHGRPTEAKGNFAVGYLVSADNAPSLAFPGDVRNYSLEDIEDLKADHCFAHVWLTDYALNPEKYIPMSRNFADFMLAHSRRSIFLTHLYVDRSEDKMWTMKHARVASDAIHESSPGTMVRVPRFGEIFDLSSRI